MVQTSLIIPAYHPTKYHKTLTETCLESLEYGRPDEVLVIIDEEGIGFAHTVNRGLAQATGDILIISNNDITFIPGWLEAIVKPLENGYDISSIRTTDQGTWTTEDKLTEGDKFGSLWAMKRKVYETLGGLDEQYGKGYFEDLDYRRQALNAGFKVAKNHAGIVEHIGRATFGDGPDQAALYERNKKLYIKKWGRLE